jgi:hypothetical protein
MNELGDVASKAEGSWVPYQTGSRSMGDSRAQLKSFRGLFPQVTLLQELDEA